MVTNLQLNAEGPLSWRLTWSGPTDATFYVYRDGVLAATTQATSYTFSVAAGESPVLDVEDNPAVTPAGGFPGQVVLQWFGVAGTKRYRVDQSISAAWIERASIADEGETYYTWASATQPDAVVSEWRVVAEGINGNDGTAATFTVLMVRYPDPPDVAYAYASTTGTASITAA